MPKEFDTVQFNKTFEQYDLDNKNTYKEGLYKQNVTTNNHSEYTQIDQNILLMRLSFDNLILHINKQTNPVDSILNNDNLTKGTINLFLFIGVLTLILGGLMK